MPNAGLLAAARRPLRLRRRAGVLRGDDARFLAPGARIVGGCCGTTPEHIAAMRAALDAPRPATGLEARRRPRPPVVAAPRIPAAPTPGRRLRRRPASRRPSRRDDSSSRSRSTRRAASASNARSRPPASSSEAGVDVVNVSDSAMARVRMSALAVAFGIQHDLDLECLVHCTTRDRNLMAPRVRAARRPRPGRAQHPGPDRRPAPDRRLPDGHAAYGTSIRSASSRSWPASTGLRIRPAARSASGPGFTIACALDPTAADRDDRMGSPGAQAGGRRPPGHDPAALLDRPGRGDARRGPPPLRAPRPARCRSCSASCRWSRHATPSSSTTRCPASRSPTRRGPRCRRPASAARRLGPRDGQFPARGEVEGEVAGTYIMPSFGRYEQGAGARPADPGTASGAAAGARDRPR